MVPSCCLKTTTDTQNVFNQAKQDSVICLEVVSRFRWYPCLVPLPHCIACSKQYQGWPQKTECGVIFDILSRQTSHPVLYNHSFTERKSLKPNALKTMYLDLSSFFFF